MSIKLLIIAMTAFGSMFGVGLTGRIKKRPENPDQRHEGPIIDEKAKKDFAKAIGTPEVTVSKTEEPSSPKPRTNPSLKKLK